MKKFKILKLTLTAPFKLLANVVFRNSILGFVLLRSILRVLKVLLVNWLIQVYNERISWLSEAGKTVNVKKRKNILDIHAGNGEILLANNYLGSSITPSETLKSDEKSINQQQLMKLIHNEQKRVLKKLGFDANDVILGPEWVAAIGHIAHSTLFPKMYGDAKKVICFYSKCANPQYLKILNSKFTYLKLPEDLKEVINLYLFAGKTSMTSIHIPTNCENQVKKGGFSFNGGVASVHEAITIAEHIFRTKNGSAPLFKPVEPNETNEKLLKLIEKSSVKNFFITLHIRNSLTSFTRGANNANHLDYVSTIKWLINQGVMVIRLGDKSMPPLKIETNYSHLYLDYAHSEYKSPENDMYLLTNCKFMIGSTSGPSFVPNDFGIPVLITNLPTIGLAPLCRGYFIPHLFKNRENGKLLSFRQMYASETGWKNPLEFKKYIRIENSSRDILDGSKRMLAEYKNLTSFSEIRYERFEEIRKPFNLSSAMAIEPNFLDRYSELLYTSETE